LATRIHELNMNIRTRMPKYVSDIIKLCNLDHLRINTLDIFKAHVLKVNVNKIGSSGIVAIFCRFVVKSKSKYDNE